jgi:hypothetical protein
MNIDVTKVRNFIQEALQWKEDEINFQYFIQVVSFYKERN